MKNILNFAQEQTFKLLTFIFLIIQITQLLASDIKVNGYYVNLKGDTIKTNFVLPLYNAKIYDTTKNSTLNDDLYTYYTKVKKPNPRKIQWKIYLINELGIKIKLLPSHCKYFQINYPNDTLKYISISNKCLATRTAYPFSYYPDSLFIRILINGPLSLYQYFENKEISSHSYKNPTFPIYYKAQKYCLMKKDDEYPHTYSSLFFKSNMIKYLFDCEKVVLKLENRDYRESDIKKIVEEYNICLMNKNSL